MPSLSSTALRNWLPVFLVLLAGPLAAHDVDVTGVARMFLDEIDSGVYRLSIVDRQVPPIRNLQEVVPVRCEVLEDPRELRFRCDPQLSQSDRLLLPWSLEGLVVVARWSDGTEGSGYFRGTGTVVPVPLSALRAGSSSIAALA
ncbi:MAG: hypothetical protein KDI29_11395, partial [Pseudomonadales bacterium]|nr:hypothetical protein [Pseudomonadales bacterium]